jgi:hypothetical protein
MPIINIDQFLKSEDADASNYDLNEGQNRHDSYDLEQDKKQNLNLQKLGQKQDLIITMLQNLTDSSSIHNATAATRTNIAEIVRAESDRLERNLLACIKASPIEAVELLTKMLFIFAVFSLVVTAISEFSIVNPTFALLILFSALAGYGMVMIRKKSLKKDGE